MSKGKPITKLMDTYLRSSPIREPPTTNKNIQIVNLPKGFCALVLVAKKNALILKFGFD
jgi:hypothetical protein